MNDVISNDYINDLNKIKETIRENQNKAMIVVNSAMIMTYYEIGVIINKRKTWGSKYIQKLSGDLKEYGKGYSVRNLQKMVQFASNFIIEEITPQVVAQIPWGTIIEIMQKGKSHEEMILYINQTSKFSWSRSKVLQKFKEQTYERDLIEPDTSVSIKNDDTIKELFKDTYVFNFLTKENTKTEKSTKDALIDNVIEFVKELGNGFIVVNKEHKIITPDNKAFYIDLLLYHIKLHLYVVIEIKNRSFRPQDLGQLSFYVGAVDDIERTVGDNETVGLLLCKNADSYTAKTTLNRINAKIGISKYKVLEELPNYLERKLNGVE
ncbi:MAG: PDDEXK nuclease domain-containing protein [bacterium]|nr:PDDEXK nuclease domain-containing protein [bacterium]